MRVRVLVLTGFGINCDYETAFAFKKAGAAAERIHLNDILETPRMLDDYHIFVVPGGFSFGDDIASGKILANRLRYRLGIELTAFVESGKLVLGVCNGFQVLTKMGMLPRTKGRLEQETTLVWNDSGRFEDRWVSLRVAAQTACVWLQGLDRLELPVRHGEGKFIARDATVMEDMERRGMIALKYVTRDGEPARGKYPDNPNGSINDIAGICDPSGRIFGLMPHPEGHIVRTQHPRWTRDLSVDPSSDGIGLEIFRNAVRYVEQNL